MIEKLKSIRSLSRQDVKRYYRESLSDLRQIQNIILIGIIAFLIGISIGLAFPSQFEGILAGFARSVQHLIDKNAFALIGLIFLRNSIAALISIVLGIFCALIPIASAIFNGALIGVVLSKIKEVNKLSALFLLMPHGIFELPAIFISWGLGIWLGIYMFRKNEDTIKERRKKAFRIYGLIVLPLLLIAAIIEGSAIIIGRAI